MSRPLRPLAAIACAGWLLTFQPASAQDPLADLPDPTSPDALREVASRLGEEAKDRALIADLLDKTLKGSDGDTIGKVRDFVLVPGGRLIAAIVETTDGPRIALPFTAVKLVGSAQSRGLEVPLTASEVSEMEELESLADSLTR